MSQFKQAINLFEYLATNVHHKVSIKQLLVNQSIEINEIYLSNSSEFLKKYFSTEDYLADSIKVTEI